MKFANNSKLFAELKKALGLEGHVLQRLVIELDAGSSLPRVYVKKLLLHDEASGVVRAVADAEFEVVEADVSVGPDGEISP